MKLDQIFYFRGDVGDAALLEQTASERNTTRSEVLRGLIRSLAMSTQESENRLAADTIPQ